MTKSPLTDKVQLAVPSQHSSRQGAEIDTVLWHHMASTAGQATTDGMQKGSLPVSANYTILDDGTLILVVDEDRRAHTSGSPYDGGKGAAWDRRSITIEIENETGAPGWGISKAALTTAARLQADLRKRYTIRNVFGHRDLNQKFGASYATYCPGPNTVSRILELEKSVGGQAASASGGLAWPYAQYTAREGDTLWSIAHAHNISSSLLSRMNGGKTSVRVGDKLTVTLAHSKPRNLPSWPFYDYVVQRGDTLWDIAHAHRVSVAYVKARNGVESDLIHPGDELSVTLRYVERLHVVKSGETLWSIAHAARVSEAYLARLNGVKTVELGDVVRVPTRWS